MISICVLRAAFGVFGKSTLLWMNYSGVIQEFPGIQVDQFRRVEENGAPSGTPVIFLLTHAHSDHLQGLDSTAFTGPLIYCSEATKRIVLQLKSQQTGKLKYSHLEPLLRGLSVNTPHRIPLSATRSVDITLLDANHCPGSTMFLLREVCVPDESDARHVPKSVLITGDVRAEPWWVEQLRYHPAMMPLTFDYNPTRPTLDCIYLDTTYGYRDEPFQAINPNVDGIRDLLCLLAQYPDTTTFVFTNLTLGYELVWLAIAQTFQTKLHIEDDGLHMFQFLLDMPPAECPWGNLLVPWLTTDPSETRFHICQKSCGCLARSRRDTVFVGPVVSVSPDELHAKNAGMPLDAFEKENGQVAINVSTSDQQPSYENSDITFEEAIVDYPDPTFQLFMVNSDSESGATYAFGNRRFVLSKDKQHILPANIWYSFSRHSSWAECKHFISLFRVKRIQPCFIPHDKSLDFSALCWESPKLNANEKASPRPKSSPEHDSRRQPTTPYGRKQIPALIRIPPKSVPSRSSTSESHSQILQLLAGAYKSEHEAPDMSVSSEQSHSPAPNPDMEEHTKISTLASKLVNNPLRWFDLDLKFRDAYDIVLSDECQNN